MYVLASAIKEMRLNETITEAPKDCDDSGALWESGKRIFNYLKTRNIRGDTGQVAFDDNGDRIYAEYDVINIRGKQKKQIVGSFYYDAVSRFVLSSSIVILRKNNILPTRLYFLNFIAGSKNNSNRSIKRETNHDMASSVLSKIQQAIMDGGGWILVF